MVKWISNGAVAAIFFVLLDTSCSHPDIYRVRPSKYANPLLNLLLLLNYCSDCLINTFPIILEVGCAYCSLSIGCSEWVEAYGGRPRGGKRETSGDITQHGKHSSAGHLHEGARRHVKLISDTVFSSVKNRKTGCKKNTFC
ncbi:hypothetical protein TNIN_87791 [Trichonephila inaurata madagascariensis]|uniref:Secreted protein n=1 Tax=Trichonephila inaurata madagascariensis TaxID=2747483 RepID=A0A8X7CLJ1_9ARAC|nr:hypothetical protein TNIN_87791 [Trichonephila inaurata madagascariensis]